jgi:hypothetical protein
VLDKVAEAPKADNNGEEEETWDMQELILGNPTTLHNMIVMILNWCFVCFGYYMMSIGIANMGGNMFFNSVSGSSAGLAACLFSGTLFACLELKTVMLLSHLIAIAGMLSQTLYNGENW